MRIPTHHSSDDDATDDATRRGHLAKSFNHRVRSTDPKPVACVADLGRGIIELSQSASQPAPLMRVTSGVWGAVVACEGSELRLQT